MLKDCNNKKAMSLCKGKESLLIPYTDTLLSFIFELRETGMPVSTTMVLMKAAQICHEFCEKTREAHKTVCQGSWDGALNWYPFIPMSTRREALDLIITTCPKLTGPEQHQDYIINMDQTHVPFIYNAKSTLDVVGI